MADGVDASLRESVRVLRLVARAGESQMQDDGAWVRVYDTKGGMWIETIS